MSFSVVLSLALASSAFLFSPSAWAVDGPPSVTIDTVSHSVVSARVTGTATPDPSYEFDSYWTFQHRVAGQSDWQDDVYWAESNRRIPPGSGPTSVERRFTALKANTEYEVRLLGHDVFERVNISEVKTFKTDPISAQPEIVSLDPPASAYTTAHLSAVVNPDGGDMDAESGPDHQPGPVPIPWRFEINRNNEGWNFAAQGAIESTDATSTSGVPIQADIGSLSPDSTYRFRLLIFYAGDEQISPEGDEFVTKPVAVPLVTTDDASAVTDSGAHFSGTVTLANADQAFNASCRFEYVTQEAYEDAGNVFPEGGAPGIPCEPEPVLGSSSQPVSVSANVTGLHPGTAYHVRMVAQNAAGASIDEAPNTFTITAAAPTVALDLSTPIFPSGVTVRGYVNPHNSEITDCRFEYGISESYGQSVDCVPNSPGTHEVQKLTVGATAGQFNLSLDGESTGGTISGDLHAGSNAITDFTPVTANLSGGEEISGPGIPAGTRIEYISENSIYLNKEATADIPDATLAAGLAFDATASEVENALAGLDAVGGGNLTVTGGPGNGPGSKPYRITFHGALADTDVTEIIASNGPVPLSGGSGASVATVAPFILDEPVHVTVLLPGLLPGAVYHYRLVATNIAGSSVSPDEMVESFATPESDDCSNASSLGASFLPDCRAYEMVSPPAKNGGDVIVRSERTRAATDGNAVGFASLSAFGDAVGTGVAIEYISERETNPDPGDSGWSTHAITPPQEPLTVAGITSFVGRGYLGEFSPDLDRGVFNSWSPVDDDPNVASAINLYRGDNLRTSGTSQYDLLTPCDLCGVKGEPLRPVTEGRDPALGGSSTDLSRVLFESRFDLTNDSPTQPNPATCNAASRLGGVQQYCWVRLYEWDNGQLSFAGLIPPGSETSCGGGGPACVPAEASIAGRGASGVQGTLPSQHAISGDGSRVFFTVPTDEAGQVVTTATQGKLYMRTDNETTEQLNASERTDLSTYRRATFWGATPDGAHAFFITEQLLTDADTGGLYVYDATKPASDPHNLTLIDPGASALMGSSDDGSYVYFLRGEQINLWHDGDVSLIGDNGTSQFLESAKPDSETRVTPNGRYLVFSTRNAGGFGTRFDPGVCDVNGTPCTEVYLYSADTHGLSCISCPSDGSEPKGGAEINVAAGAFVVGKGRHLNHAMSDDGRYAFFTSADALVPNDTNGKKDAYEYKTRTGEVSLLSSGTDPFDSYFVEVTPNGLNAFINTRERLSEWDIDGNYDIYDARVEGGFPEPKPVPALCSGDSCQGSGETVRGEQLNPARLVGPSDKASQRRKKRGHRRSHHRHGKKQHKRTANHERGARR